MSYNRTLLITSILNAMPTASRFPCAVSASCLTDDERHGHLRRHADLLMADARVGIVNASDLADVEHRYARFCQVVDDEHHGDWTVPQRG